MVSTISVAAIIVTLLVTFILPIIGIIIYALRQKGKGVFLAWLIGAAGFFVMQVVIRLPILSVLNYNKSFSVFCQENYVLYLLILAFTAGLFEVIARYVAAIVLKKKMCYEVAVGAGMGHGGIEAMVLVGLTYVNNLLYAIMINTGAYDMMVESVKDTGMDVSTLLQLKDTMIETSAGLFLMAGYERILTMTAHVAMSLIVFYFVYKKKTFAGILLCLFAHTMLDFFSAFFIYQMPKNTAYICTYVFLTIAAIISVFIIRTIGKKWKTAE